MAKTPEYQQPLLTAFVEDRKSIGVGPQTSAGNTLHTRDLNTLSGDTSFISINGTDNFTLQPGKYTISAITPSVQTIYTQPYIYNDTASEYVGTGRLQLVQTDDGGVHTVECVVEITVASDFEIRLFTSTAGSLGGYYDTANNPNTYEVYTTVKITKL